MEVDQDKISPRIDARLRRLEQILAAKGRASEPESTIVQSISTNVLNQQIYPIPFVPEDA